MTEDYRAGWRAGRDTAMERLRQLDGEMRSIAPYGHVSTWHACVGAAFNRVSQLQPPEAPVHRHVPVRADAGRGEEAHRLAPPPTPPPPVPSVEDEIQAIAAKVPPEEWAKLPPSTTTPPVPAAGLLGRWREALEALYHGPECKTDGCTNAREALATLDDFARRARETLKDYSSGDPQAYALLQELIGERP